MQCLVDILELGHRQHRAKDFFLEDAHLVMALEHGRLDIEAVFQPATQVGTLTASQHGGAFVLAQLQVALNLVHLFLRRLRADHGGRVQRVTLLDFGYTLECALHKAVVDGLVYQRAAWAGAHLTLVQRKHHEAFNRLVEESVVFGGHVVKEDVRRFAAQLQRDRNQVFAGVVHDQAAHRGRAGKGDLGDALAGGQRLAGFGTKAVHDVQHARWQQVAHQLGKHQNGQRGLLGRFQHDAVAGRQCRGNLPRGHQQREVPRNDLAHHAQRLVEVVRHGGSVDLADAAFLCADAAGKVAEMVDRQRQVGVGGFADRLAVVEGFHRGQGGQVLLHTVGNTVQDERALCHAGFAPGTLGGVGGVQRQLDIGRVRARNLAQYLAGYRGNVLEIAAVNRWLPLAVDEVGVTGFQVQAVLCRGNRAHLCLLCVGVTSPGVNTTLHLPCQPGAMLQCSFTVLPAHAAIQPMHAASQ